MWFAGAIVLSLIAANFGVNGGGSSHYAVIAYRSGTTLSLDKPDTIDSTHDVTIDIVHVVDGQIRTVDLILQIDGRPAPLDAAFCEALAEHVLSLGIDHDLRPPSKTMQVASMIRRGKTSSTRATPLGAAVRACSFVLSGIVIMSPVVGAIRLARARHFRQQLARWHQGRCPACNYDMATDPGGRCPECGSDTETVRRHAMGMLNRKNRSLRKLHS